VKHKPTWRSPADVADELVAQRVHAFGCEECDELGSLCPFHEGYREGCLTLLIKATLR
jgi:hypothetical protein